MHRLFEALHEAFHRGSSPVYRTINHVIWALIIVSVGIFFVDTGLGENRPPWLHTLDLVVLGIFALEYLLRVMTYWPPALDVFTMSRWQRLREHLLGRLRFSLRPISLIDLVTILALVPAMRGLRALRMLRLIRTWKFFPYSDPVAKIIRTFRDNGLLFTFAFSLLGVATLVGGILTAFTIRSHLREAAQKHPRKNNLYVVAEILDAENVGHALTAGADEVIETTRLGFSLLAHAIAMPGTAAIMSRVASVGTHSLYMGRIPKDHATPAAFAELAESIKFKTGALVIGVRIADTNTDRLNPPGDLQITADDRIVYLSEKQVLEQG